jgi:putative urate catabolism protein
VQPSSPPRDLIGYGANPPFADWPGGARVAVSFVMNYEEGAEYNVLNGDAHSETLLSDLYGLEPLRGLRHMNIESAYEYGSRTGFWNLMELFADRELPVTIYAVADALERNPEAAAAIKAAGYEVVSHGLRWIDYQYFSREDELRHMLASVDIIERMIGERPVGWYTGRPSPNTRQLVVETGLFEYDSDAYNDDLPYWTVVGGTPHLVVPYTLDNNDSRFTRGQGFDVGEEFFQYLKDGFDYLYAQGERRPRMMSVGLHCRMIGRPGRIGSLARFIDYVKGHDRVWLPFRRDIARHWKARHPFPAASG